MTSQGMQDEARNLMTAVEEARKLLFPRLGDRRVMDPDTLLKYERVVFYAYRFFYSHARVSVEAAHCLSALHDYLLADLADLHKGFCGHWSGKRGLPSLLGSEIERNSGQILDRSQSLSLNDYLGAVRRLEQYLAGEPPEKVGNLEIIRLWISKDLCPKGVWIPEASYHFNLALEERRSRVRALDFSVSWEYAEILRSAVLYFCGIRDEVRGRSRVANDFMEFVIMIDADVQYVANTVMRLAKADQYQKSVHKRLLLWVKHCRLLRMNLPQFNRNLLYVRQAGLSHEPPLQKRRISKRVSG